MEVFTRDSAWWAFDFVANFMNINYANMFEKLVGPTMEKEQKKIIDAVDRVEKTGVQDRQSLSEVQSELQKLLVENWWKMSDDLIVLFNDGVYNKPHKLPSGKTAPVQTLGYPA